MISDQQANRLSAAHAILARLGFTDFRQEVRVEHPGEPAEQWAFFWFCTQPDGVSYSVAAVSSNCHFSRKIIDHLCLTLERLAERAAAS